MKLPFLTASWENILAINWQVDPALLANFVPRGTELDSFENKIYISLIAFNFNRNKFLGIVPTYPYSFPEINLRFYVKRKTETGTKRAAVFINEIVPSKLIAATANIFYNEPYQYSKLNYSVKENLHRWLISKPVNSYQIEASLGAESRDLKQGTHEEFIYEHYWGYNAQPDAQTLEYQVAHPRWRTREVTDYKIDPHIAELYGAQFAEILNSKPDSVYYAEGSDISVSFPQKFFSPLNSSKPLGWVLYDGSCGFCSWWIPYWKKAIEKAGYQTASVQTEWVRKKLNMSDQELNNDIRLLLNDDTLINGADAYLYGMKQVWWAYPFGVLFSLPGLRQLTWLFYKIFNRNRFFVSRVCKFKPEI